MNAQSLLKGKWLVIRRHIWPNTSQVERPETVMRVNADQAKRLRLRKQLIISDEYVACRNSLLRVTAGLRARLTPLPIMRSLYYVPDAKMVESVNQYLTECRDVVNKNVESLCRVYAKQVAQARSDLGNLWNADDYPGIREDTSGQLTFCSEDLRRHFGLTWQWFAPFTLASGSEQDWLAELDDAAASITDMLREELASRVKLATSRLEQADDVQSRAQKEWGKILDVATRLARKVGSLSEYLPASAVSILRDETSSAAYRIEQIAKESSTWQPAKRKIILE